MGFTATAAAGAKVRASSLAAWLTERTPLQAIKTSATSRNTTVSRTADPDLTLALPANSAWEVQIVLLLSSAANAAGDFSGEIAFPTGSTVSSGGHGLDIGLASGATSSLTAGTASSSDSSTPTTNIDWGCSTIITEAVLRARVTTSTAGSVTLNWAQSSTNGSNTTVNIGSRIVATKVN